MNILVDLAGQRFGRLVVLSRGTNSREGKPRWLCRCDCGTEREIRAVTLRNGGTRSCGCLARELTRRRATLHGETGSREHQTWRRMWQRCSDPGCPAYAYYGVRGIRVCERWESFENFLADMGRRPSPAHSLDRIDVNGNYEPSNCRWATITEQNRNKRSNVLVKFRGQRKTVAEWSRDIGISEQGLHARLQRGWTIADALTRPARSARHG